jgi:glycosyltransferase involved in cell wall biosynthesis
MRQCLPVAVVVPAHNAAGFLDETLKSVRAQTTPPSEVIVVDDGSTDRTTEVARRHRVTLLSQSRRGPSAARNVAVRATAQPWIAFLDADDVWEPEKLEAQWQAVQACPEVGAVFCDFIEFDANGAIGGSYFSGKPNYQKIKRTEVAPGVMACDLKSLGEQLVEGSFLAPSTLLVRRDLLLQVGLFDPTVWGREDIDCMLRLSAVCPMAVVERPLMRSRVHASNLTQDGYRMAVAGIVLTERILESPGKYPPGTAEQYRRRWPRWELNAGRFAEERGELQRAHYLRAWRLGGGVTPLGSAMLSWLPAPVRRLARVLRHRLLPG